MLLPHKPGVMSQFKFSCPQCDQHLQCDEAMSGRQIQCPSCNVLIRIPPVPGKTDMYNPESGKTWATFVPGANVPPPDIKLHPKTQVQPSPDRQRPGRK